MLHWRDPIKMLQAFPSSHEVDRFIMVGGNGTLQWNVYWIVIKEMRTISTTVVLFIMLAWPLPIIFMMIYKDVQDMATLPFSDFTKKIEVSYTSTREYKKE